MDMEGMFDGCSSLTSLDVSGFKTGKVTSMSNMFAGCSLLTSLDVSGFKTDNVAYMAWMFSECRGLTTLDLSSFKTDNVVTVRCMFINCIKLETIYVRKDWNLENVIDEGSSYVFKGCGMLVGGQGTAYDENHTDYTYARIDGGSDAPGYFTYKKTINGDVNLDGSVDVADIASVIDYMAGNDAIDKDAADVNGDGSPDVADISAIIDIMAKGPYINYNCPDDNHPHTIDLGLPSGTKWACCNAGATTPEECGGYYTFEDAQAYNPPTLDQLKELKNNTTQEAVTQNDMLGTKITGSNGKSIFLPCTGQINPLQTEPYGIGEMGYYWTSSTWYYEKYDTTIAYFFDNNYGKMSDSYIGDTTNLYLRQSVRPVKK